MSRRVHMQRRAMVVLLLATVALVIVITKSGTSGHELTLTADNADLVRDGLAVRLSGRKVGVVTATKVTPDWKAKVTFRVDDAAWPLPADTKAALRWGGTIKFTDRYIELDRGKATATLADGAELRPGSFTSPVEVDTLLDTFNTETRANLRSTLDAGGLALRPATKPLRRALVAAPPALRETSDLLGDLGSDQGALSSLITSGASVIDAIQRSYLGVGTLIDGAQTTFAAVATKSVELKNALAQTPSTLTATRATLARADKTLINASALTRKLHPAVPALQRLAAPLDSTLRRVTQVAPDLTGTLRTLRTAAPRIDTLVSRLTTQSPRLASISKQAAIQVGCLRPYAPTLSGLIGTWTNVWGRGDSKDKYLRALLGTYPYQNALPATSAQTIKAFPGLTYAYPQPPGLANNRPWFQPQCHIGPEVMDASKDPEAKPFNFQRTPLSVTAVNDQIKPPGTSPPGTIDRDYPAPAGVKR